MKVTLTAEDLANNPELEKEGLKVGDECDVPTGPFEHPEESKDEVPQAETGD